MHNMITMMMIIRNHSMVRFSKRWRSPGSAKHRVGRIVPARSLVRAEKCKARRKMKKQFFGAERRSVKLTSKNYNRRVSIILTNLQNQIQNGGSPRVKDHTIVVDGEGGQSLWAPRVVDRDLEQIRMLPSLMWRLELRQRLKESISVGVSPVQPIWRFHRQVVDGDENTFYWSNFDTRPTLAWHGMATTNYLYAASDILLFMLF
mmetsp:Transcript_23444/g.34775  ORF Transcript_23444/g.34775 Transcript_23444/m.34775 type:complete len:204 (-) Transcript_23444:57-668(-)